MQCELGYIGHIGINCSCLEAQKLEENEILIRSKQRSMAFCIQRYWT